MNKGAFDEIKLRFSKKDMSFIPKDGKKRRRLLLILAAVLTVVTGASIRECTDTVL